MKTSEKPKKPSGKEQGKSFGWCLARARLYSQDLKAPWPFLYIIPLSLAWLVCDFALRYHYRWVGTVDYHYLPANLFTVGWTLLMVGLVMALPWKAKWPVRCIPLMFCMANMETHSAFYNFFEKFFSLSVLSYASGNGQFIKREYIHIDRAILLGAIATIILMMCSGRLLQVIPPRTTKRTVAAGLIVAAVGGGLIGWTAHTYYPTLDTVIWATEEKDQNNSVYQNFTDPTNCVMLSGLHQYTARDVWRLIRPASTISDHDRRQVEEYIAQYNEEKRDNEFTGALAGKNLILVQLEAMDTWLIDPDYTPTLARLKEEGISFTNHFTPAYISAGTFNTEFQVNTSLLPATGGIPTNVYSQNDFPRSLAGLFRAAGYTANSFHNSEGDVYDRGNVHPNLGYERYISGSDMAMPNYQMDRYLINGYDQMVPDQEDPFFTFVITYSVHGPYGVHSEIYQENAAAAQAKAKRTDGNYVYAVAGAMETERFIADLYARLEESGHLDDTVLAFYADHYDYYMLDDELQMKIKGAESLNMLQHTDFFIWSKDLAARQVEKVTASVDVLPTLANLFGLDTAGTFLAGHDGLGDGGGYVFFNDGSWYDGSVYWDSASGQEADPARTAEINTVRTLCNKILAGNYYGE